MSKLKINVIIGFFFVSILGTLAHFLYKWTGNNPIVGLVTPINESTWEHMKLLFFPMLLYFPTANYFLKDKYPYIANAFAYGILAGTLFIPIFFYTYSGILGNTIMAVDIASFYIAVAFGFYISYRLAKKKVPLGTLGLSLLIVCTFLFAYFTYKPLEFGIFQDITK